MRFSKIYTAQHRLLQAHIVSVETDIARGLHSFNIVGLPNKAVEESRDRVSAAIKNCGFKSPKQTNAKVTVSLAPSDMRKEGPAFDLPMALGYLLAAENISFDPKGKLFAGELSLDGTVRPIRGALSYARLAQKEGFAEIYVPEENAAEAALVKGIAVFGARSLRQVVSHLTDIEPIQRHNETPFHDETEHRWDGPDLDDVVGHETAKRGLIIAAAGRHNIGFFGPPGTGKTMLARAFASILPPLSFEEALEVTEIHSIAGALDGAMIEHPPVRTPHHTASYTAIVGGGSSPRPGEITLAHRGAIFFDEFPEFDKRVIEALRQPLEDRSIVISRAGNTARFPADFVLIAAMNPCPCGNKGISDKECVCSPRMVKNYEKKISGPIIDRIDMWIEMSKVEHSRLMKQKDGSKQTTAAKEMVMRARRIQKNRSKRFNIDAETNSALSARDLPRAALLSPDAKDSLDRAAVMYGISGRGYHRTVRLARTIADLASSQNIEAPHVLEALQYRKKAGGAD